MPPVAIVLSGGLVMAAWVFHKPEKFLPALLFLIPLGNLTVIFPPSVAGGAETSFLSTLTLPKIGILAILGAWLVRTLVLRDDRPFQSLSRNHVMAAIGLYFLASVFSGLNAAALDTFAAYERRILNLFLLVFLITNLLTEKQQLTGVLTAFVLSYLVVGFIGLYEAVSRHHFLDLIGYPIPEMRFAQQSEAFRVIGPTGDPDFFAISVIFGFFTCLGAFFMAEGKVLRLALLPLLAIFLVDMFGSGSRGGLIGLILGTVPFFYFVRSRRKYAVAATGLIAAVGVFLAYTLVVSPLTLSRYTGETGTASLGYRLGWLKMALRMITDHPILGVGTYNFVVLYPRYWSPGVPLEPFMTHNTYIQVWAENGSVGLLAYLSIYVLTFLNLVRAARRARDPAVSTIATVFLSTFTGMIFFAGTSNVLVNELYWIVFACSHFIFRVSGETSPQETRTSAMLSARPERSGQGATAP